MCFKWHPSVQEEFVSAYLSGYSILKRVSVDLRSLALLHLRQRTEPALSLIHIFANQTGKNTPNEKYRFEYRSGAIEDDMPYDAERKDVLGKQGIQQHICDILEGGKIAFDLRKHKYRMNSR